MVPVARFPWIPCLFAVVLATDLSAAQASEQAVLGHPTQLPVRGEQPTGITVGDFDGDGAMDYAVTNFGLNTKYHLKPGKPLKAYYGIFDETGKERFVEAQWEGDTLFPIRGKSCSTDAKPHLKDKYKSFVEFS